MPNPFMTPKNPTKGILYKLKNIQLTGNVTGNKSLTSLKGTSGIDSGTIRHDELVLNGATNEDHDDRYEQFKDRTIVVAKSGGQYTSIQDAIDSITDNSSSKPYVIRVFPGEYAENIVMEDYVSIIGMGQVPWETIISGTNSDPLVTFDTDSSSSSISNVYLKLSPTSDGQSLVKQTNGTHALWQCSCEISSASNGIAADMFDIQGGTFFSMFNQVVYNMTGSAAGAKIHRIYKITGTGSYMLQGNRIDMTVDDVDDIAIIVDEQSGAAEEETFIFDNNIHLELTNASYTGASGGFYLHGSGGDKQLQRNHLHVESSGAGLGYAVFMDTAANNGVIQSSHNWVTVEGFSGNYGTNVGTGDTVNSTFNFYDTDDGNTGAGTVNYVNCYTPGELHTSGTITADSWLEIEDGSSSSAVATSDHYRFEANAGRLQGIHDSAGVPADDLSIQEQETFHGNALAMAAESGQLWQESTHSGADGPQTITATPVFAHTVSTHQTTDMYGIWEWIGIRNGEYLQSDFSAGFDLKNFSECNKIKVTVKHKIGAAVSDFDSAAIYICHSASGETPQTSALTLSTSWVIETHTFDISSWDFSGAGESPIVGVEFIGDSLSSPGASNCAVYLAWITVEGYAI